MGNHRGAEGIEGSLKVVGVGYELEESKRNVNGCDADLLIRAIAMEYPERGYLNT
jgi:hypothetical protein